MKVTEVPVTSVKPASTSIKKSVEVPDHTPVSSVATLHCNYHLGKDKLYSVKWYKDSSEFYRFVPKMKADCSSRHY